LSKGILALGKGVSNTLVPASRVCVAKGVPRETVLKHLDGVTGLAQEAGANDVRILRQIHFVVSHLLLVLTLNTFVLATNKTGIHHCPVRHFDVSCPRHGTRLATLVTFGRNVLTTKLLRQPLGRFRGSILVLVIRLTCYVLPGICTRVSYLLVCGRVVDEVLHIDTLDSGSAVNSLLTRIEIPARIILETSIGLRICLLNGCRGAFLLNKSLAFWGIGVRTSVDFLVCNPGIRITGTTIHKLAASIIITDTLVWRRKRTSATSLRIGSCPGAVCTHRSVNAPRTLGLLL